MVACYNFQYQGGLQCTQHRQHCRLSCRFFPWLVYLLHMWHCTQSIHPIFQTHLALMDHPLSKHIMNSRNNIISVAHMCIAQANLLVCSTLLKYLHEKKLTNIIIIWLRVSFFKTFVMQKVLINFALTTFSTTSSRIYDRWTVVASHIAASNLFLSYTRILQGDTNYSNFACIQL